jgi:hypothetical protein
MSEMVGRKITVHISGLGMLSGTLVRDSKDFWIIKDEKGKNTTVVKKWVTMFRFGEKDSRPPIYVYGVSSGAKPDTGVRFFRVGSPISKEGEKLFLDAVSVTGSVCLIGEIGDLDEAELKSSLDGTITGDNS